jgi:hypothetical protein
MRPDSVAHYSALNGRLNKLCDWFADACEGCPQSMVLCPISQRQKALRLRQEMQAATQRPAVCRP